VQTILGANGVIGPELSRQAGLKYDTGSSSGYGLRPKAQGPRPKGWSKAKGTKVRDHLLRLIL
jgi:hypothetical protein